MTTTEVRPTLGPVAAEWDALVDRMARPSPFLRSWWLDAVAGADARYVLTLDGDDLIGGVAVTLDRRRGVKRCRLAGSGPLAPHNLDAVAAPGDEARVLAGFDAFLRTAGPGLVDLLGIDADSAIAASAAAGARVEQIDAAPWIDVRPDFESYVASRRRKLRQELRRVQRRLDERDLAHREVGGPDAERALRTFAELHRLRWGRDSLVLPVLSTLVTALRAGLARGEVSIQEVAAGDRVVASLVSFEVAGVASWYQMGRDPDPRWSNSGTFLKAHAVARSCRLGHSRIDLCVGTPRQKVEWSDGQRPVMRVRWARNAAGRAVMGGLVALERVADARRTRRTT